MDILGQRGGVVVRVGGGVSGGGGFSAYVTAPRDHRGSVIAPHTPQSQPMHACPSHSQPAAVLYSFVCLLFIYFR